MVSLCHRIVWTYLVISLFVLVSSCNREAAKTSIEYVQLSGQTMGTTWHVTYKDTSGQPLQPLIDSMLVQINQEVSTYIPSSVISEFNSSEVGLVIDHNILRPQGNPHLPNSSKSANLHFLANFIAAAEVYRQSGGAFDPTVMPLVNYWGFGYEPRQQHDVNDTAAIDSILQYVGFDEVIRAQFSDSSSILKSSPGVQLDFSALAKGHAVDIITLLLQQFGITDALVEIGGEVRATGVNPSGVPWNIGISTPIEGADSEDFERIVSLKNLSLATSGNYRNFYEIDGIKHSHTINPRTGFPEHNTLLSASVFSEDCRTADAWATTMMVVGLSQAQQLTRQIPEIESLLIYGGKDGSFEVWESEGLSALLSQSGM